MNPVDITATLRPGMHVWPGDDEFEMRLTSSIAGGDGVNVSNASLSLHTGTHVDAPRHYFDAARGVDRIPLSALYGPASGREAGRGPRGRGRRGPASGGVERVLFKTTTALRAGGSRRHSTKRSSR
ncbi:MAG: cyclase family protein [Chloroflexia bacterium]